MFENIVFPRLHCPFPEQISPFAEVAHERTLDWVRQHRLVNDDKAFDRLRLSKFGWLAARAYPNAARDRLEIASAWNTWLFIFDDQCDESELGKQPHQLSALHARSLETLSGKQPDPDDLPVIHALHDIRIRIQRLASQAWLTRFVKSASDYFEATLWEAVNRARKLWPNAAAYIRMRPYTGGLYTDIELIDLTEQISLPCIARTHPRLNQLVVITNNVVCWSNDIISLKKEQAHGDIHNLVLILQHQSGLSLQEAVDRVERLIDAQIRRFLVFENQLPSFGKQIDQDVARFVGVLRSWMRGNLDWAYESGRYDAVNARQSLNWSDTYGHPIKQFCPIGRFSEIESYTISHKVRKIELAKK